VKESARFHDLVKRVVFVGSCQFSNKASYFASCSIENKLGNRAMQMMNKGLRPDFSWWHEIIGTESLWPGQGVRQVGFAAEQSNQCWRLKAVEDVSRQLPFTLYGDPGWLKFLAPEIDLRSEVGYYRGLPSLYRRAAYSLNLTSLLLPGGLTQRHFDVWVSGGFLLTDHTPGLELFPREMVEPVCFKMSKEIPDKIESIEKDSTLRRHLKEAWKKEIILNHNYDRRIEKILDWAVISDRGLQYSRLGTKERGKRNEIDH
jgi:hypothetical protein